MSTANPNLESDPRFPSGRWGGFYTDKRRPGKHQMEMVLTFVRGKMTGSGRDPVGAFVIDGAYQLNDGKCMWIKQYIGQHAVGYRGFNEGKGIWGTWDLPGTDSTGGFHIWPEGMTDPSHPELEEEAELPAEIEREGPVPVGV
jgi:hypothetical protein